MNPLGKDPRLVLNRRVLGEFANDDRLLLSSNPRYQPLDQAKMPIPELGIEPQPLPQRELLPLQRPEGGDRRIEKFRAGMDDQFENMLEI